LILEVNVTPNRGDAHVGARHGARSRGAGSGAIKTAVAGQWPRRIRCTAAHGERSTERGTAAARRRRACSPCVLRGVDNTRASPLWLRERLRRCGLRSISPVVDVTNYVMLELGQPMHAYDRSMLQGAMTARWALPGERLTLLDGREIELDPDVLVIADEHRRSWDWPASWAASAAPSAARRGTFALEVAWFVPAAIAGRARRYGLQTDASQRFERGVDWRGRSARCSWPQQLIVQLAGGEAGPVTVAEQPEALPHAVPVPLRARGSSVCSAPASHPGQIEQRLRALGMTVRADARPTRPRRRRSGALSRPRGATISASRRISSRRSRVSAASMLSPSAKRRAAGGREAAGLKSDR
jgi:phenylalanyl-tRNA synthetase beta chain